MPPYIFEGEVTAYPKVSGQVRIKTGEQRLGYLRRGKKDSLLVAMTDYMTFLTTRSKFPGLELSGHVILSFVHMEMMLAIFKEPLGRSKLKGKLEGANILSQSCMLYSIFKLIY